MGAALAIVGLMVAVPTLAFFLPESAQGAELIGGGAISMATIFWLIRRASRCPVCDEQYREGGHSLRDTVGFRSGELQFGRSERFVCSRCGTRLR